MTKRKELTTPDGLTIRSYDPAPHDFNPLTANDRELRLYGFPTRPGAEEAPELRKRWDEAFSKPRKWVTAEFTPIEKKENVPAMGLRPLPAPGVRECVSTNWSGSVVAATVEAAFQWIAGEWTVPNTYPTRPGSFFATEWIGLDGAGSSDVVQTGTATECDSTGWRDVYAWYQWFPYGAWRLTSVPVASGDIVYSLMCVNSPTEVFVVFSNETSMVTTSFTITAQAGTILAGNSAEWIVERPSESGVLHSLANYGSVYFNKCQAGLAGSPYRIVTAGDGTLVTMVNPAGARMSAPLLETTQLMRVNWLKSD